VRGDKKTKALILGGSGMLGHKLWQVFSSRFDTYVTLHRDFKSYKRYRLFNPERAVDCVSAEKFDSVARAVETVQPAVVVNCIGIVKQAEAARDPVASIEINSLFPHRLARLCQSKGIRLIHMSTDCVFSGRRGNYRESDLSDAEDLYGRTKFLGEVSGQGCLTIRTSMIGRELETSYGLIEWFLTQEGKAVSGYERAVFSGFTTNALAEIMVKIIAEHTDLHGIWHVASEPISKFELLTLVKQVYGLDIKIKPDKAVIIDRSLNADRFRQATGFVPPTWHAMIEQMYRDPTLYSELRRPYASR
jgi:dTDP-4-dehydrorhamnose reductase